MGCGLEVGDLLSAATMKRFMSLVLLMLEMGM